jgi:chromosome segregation ATPase
MKKLLVVILVLIVAVGVLAYWRGWLSMGKEGKVDVQVDSAKFKQDAKAMKDRVAGLWTKSEALTGDDKAHAQKELGELEKKHDRIEQQIKELDAAGQDRFDSIKEDLKKSLAEVDTKIGELTAKLDHPPDANPSPAPGPGKE